MSGAENQIVAVLGITAAVLVSGYLLLPYFSSIGSIARGPTLPGLRNWANWCFCNSTLQCISSIPTFRRWLDESLQATDEKTELALQENERDGTDQHLSLSATMRGMIRVLNVEGPRKILSSSPLVQALEGVQKSHISRAQQDAQEFLHLLLESIAAEQNALPAYVSIQQMRTMTQAQGRAYKKLPFEGEIQQRSICTACKHELKVQKTPFLEMTLLPPVTSSVTMTDCLQSTLESEYIEDYNCTHCQLDLLSRKGVDISSHEAAIKRNPDFELPKDLPRSRVTLERKVDISSLPDILILHVNRSLYGHYATRNSIDVTYEETLVVDGTQYELRSFVTHQGSHDRGHYIAYRQKGSRWYMISDETVRTIEKSSVLALGSLTFLMFYEKVGPENDGCGEEKAKKKRKKRKKRMSGEGVESKI